MTSPSLRPAQGIKVGLKTVYLYDADWVPVVSNAVTTCTAQAVIATTQAGISTTQAGISTAQAVISTNQAGIATSAANSLLNDAGYIAVSADLAGSNTIGICAANIAAIQAAPQAASDAESARDLAQGYATAADVAKMEYDGVWSSGTTYTINKVVFYNGSCFKSLQNANTNNTPDPTTNTAWWGRVAIKGTDGTGSGDVSTDATISVDSEIALYDSTTGKKIKRCALSGMAKMTSGVVSAGTAGTDYAKPDTKSAWSKQQSGTQYALTSTSNHIATDCDNGNNFSHTMSENTTLDNPTNIVAGTDYKWTFTQITAEKTLALGSYFKPSDGVAFAGLPTTDGAICTIFAYAETTTRLVFTMPKEGQT